MTPNLVGGFLAKAEGSQGLLPPQGRSGLLQPQLNPVAAGSRLSESRAGNHRPKTGKKPADTEPTGEQGDMKGDAEHG